MKVKVIFTILTILSITQATKIGCENFINVTKWNCDTYNYYFQERKLEQTLHCLNYKKSEKSTPQIEFQRQITQLRSVNEVNCQLILEEKFHLKFVDSRLNFDTCDNQKFVYKSEAIKHFWNPTFSKSKKTGFKPTFDKLTVLNVS